MKDQEIVALYWARDERAIQESGRIYGSYCRAIAKSILQSESDAEECVNDAYLGAWNSIPPQKPNDLRTYLGKLVRRISLDRRKYSHAQKRGGGQVTLALEELLESVPQDGAIEECLRKEELSMLIDTFLRERPLRERQVFLRRYWFLDSVADIARRYGMGQSAVKMMLHRTRERLRTRLEREGFFP